MSIKFSLVYPTKDRPQFIEMALSFLNQQYYDNFEIIISDNCSSSAFSCKTIVKKYKELNIVYLKPDATLSMAENWNFALSHCTGDYICYLTDKMFLLPGILKKANDIIQEENPDILNWTDVGFYPLDDRNYFGSGHHTSESCISENNNHFEFFSPKEELCQKAEAVLSRYEQNKSQYVRGKICFGAYNSKLINGILQTSQKLFFDISPDYTSMILALSYSKVAVEMETPGIVHINTSSLSHGGNVAIHDHKKLMYLSKLSTFPKLLSNMLVPNLYSSSHNGITSDYISISSKFELKIELNRVNWLVHISEDLDMNDRQWSSKKIENEQRSILQNYIEQKLSKQQQHELFTKLQARQKDEKRKINFIFWLKQFLKRILPLFIILKYRSFWASKKFTYNGQTFLKIDKITDLITKYNRAN